LFWVLELKQSKFERQERERLGYCIESKNI